MEPCLVRTSKMEYSSIMTKSKTEKRVKALGWKDGTVAEFLGLTPQESALIEIKLALSRKLRERREKRMTQYEEEKNGG